MSLPSSKQEVGFGSLTLTLSIESYVLDLRTPFGTSHSSSATRTNALITLRCEAKKDSKLAGGGDAAALVAHGEVGLPPKKRGCYEADYTDIYKYFIVFADAVKTAAADVDVKRLLFADPFEACPKQFFGPLRAELKSCAEAAKKDESPGFRLQVTALLSCLFGTLDRCPANGQDPSYKTAMCAFELAFMDLWGLLLQRPVRVLLGADEDDKRPVRRSFYTAALNADVEEMVKSAKFGLAYTPLLKIKLDGDVKRCETILKRLWSFYEENKVTDFAWSVDANSAWSPEIAMQFLEMVKPFASRIYMVEQPFPLLHAHSHAKTVAPAAATAGAEHKVDAKEGSSAASGGGTDEQQPRQMCLVEGDRVVTFRVDEAGIDAAVKALAADAGGGAAASGAHTAETLSRDWQGWQRVKEAYAKAGMLMFGDESISNASDIIGLRDLIHGVNIKMEKAGGYRASLTAIDAAHKNGLKVWVGIMVGSSLTCNAAGQLLPWADSGYGDIDGGLLISEDSQHFVGGFRWASGGRILFEGQPESQGLELTASEGAVRESKSAEQSVLHGGFGLRKKAGR